MFGLFKGEKKKVENLWAAFDAVQQIATKHMNVLELHTFAGGLKDFPKDTQLDFRNPSGRSTTEWLELSKELDGNARSVHSDAKLKNGIEGEAQGAIASVLAYYALRAELNAYKSTEAHALRIAFIAFEDATDKAHSRIVDKSNSAGL